MIDIICEECLIKSICNEKCYNVEVGIKSAIDAWITHGLYPGSFVYFLLKGDYEEAKLHAHPLLKPHMQDHIDYVEKLPDEYRGENMDTWKGMKK